MTEALSIPFAEKNRQSIESLRMARAIFTDPIRKKKWYEEIGKSGILESIYKVGYFPFSLPTPLPSYIIEETQQTAAYILNNLRNTLESEPISATQARAPSYLPLEEHTIRWIKEHYRKQDPHLALDFLLTLSDKNGENINTQKMGFDAVMQLVERGEAILDARVLELQTFDAYQLGWFPHGMVPAAINTYGIPNNKLIHLPSDTNDVLQKHYKDAWFLEFDPSNQPTRSNLRLISNGKIIDLNKITEIPPNVKLISRLVDSDIQKWLEHASLADIESFYAILNTPDRWVSPNFHPFAFYFGSKQTLLELSDTKTESELKRHKIEPYYDPQLILEREEDFDDYVIKPVDGQSAIGTVVGPKYEQIADALATGKRHVMQRIIHQARAIPTSEEFLGKDPDVDLGIGTEFRLFMSAGEPFGDIAKLVTIMTRNNFVSQDPRRVINGDTRGWFTNIGAILAVLKNVLGFDITSRFDADIGMGIGYSCE